MISVESPSVSESLTEEVLDSKRFNIDMSLDSHLMVVVQDS